KKHFDEKMYIDNFKLASGYSSGEKNNLRYTFNWNKKRFPNPEEFFKKMNDWGINVIPNLKPGILTDHPFIEKFEFNKSFIKDYQGNEDYVGRWWGGEGKFIDFTNPSARETWKDLLINTILKKGTLTVWNDNCEYDGVEEKQAICSYEGKTGKIAYLKSLQANMMAFTAKQAIQEAFPNKRPYIISRSGFAGIQRYAQTWAGDNLTDWRTLKYNISTIMGLGMSGLANTGCDVGGFAGPAPEGELLLRWIQNGIFQPRFCINSANNDNTVTQPWMYNEYNDYIREAYNKRYEMLPYLYSLMYEAYKNGKPVIRPLFLEFQHDTRCYENEFSTFMFGPAVLVANIIEKGAQTRKLYLPKGEVWYDINNNFKKYKGGQIIEVLAELNSIPMFLRESGIFITTKDINKSNPENLNILVGGGINEGQYYFNDDGVTKNYESNSYEKIQIAVNGKEKKKINFKKYCS